MDCCMMAGDARRGGEEKMLSPSGWRQMLKYNNHDSILHYLSLKFQIIYEKLSMAAGYPTRKMKTRLDPNSILH